MSNLIEIFFNTCIHQLQDVAEIEAQQIEAAQEITFPDVVTLIVDPQDALALSWSANSGVHMVLTLRNPQDSTGLKPSVSLISLLFSS